MARRGVGSLVALGACLVTACTSVLGMERAELSDDVGVGTGGATGTGGASGTGGLTTDPPRTEYPAAACDKPDPACQSCLLGCGLDNCVGSPACRDAINKHMNCLDDAAGCGDPDDRCAGKYFFTSDSASYTMGDCLTGSCFDACANRIQTVASTCELYCKCMEQRCPTFQAEISPCLETCTNMDLNQVYCRWQHCEAATPQDPLHCEHALGQRGHCPRALPGNTCTGKIHSGFPCRGDKAYCCSGICTAGVCQ